MRAQCESPLTGWKRLTPWFPLFLWMAGMADRNSLPATLTPRLPPSRSYSRPTDRQRTGSWLYLPSSLSWLSLWTMLEGLVILHVHMVVSSSYVTQISALTPSGWKGHSRHVIFRNFTLPFFTLSKHIHWTQPRASSFKGVFRITIL